MQTSHDFCFALVEWSHSAFNEVAFKTFLSFQPLTRSFFTRVVSRSSTVAYAELNRTRHDRCIEIYRGSTWKENRGRINEYRLANDIETIFKFLGSQVYDNSIPCKYVNVDFYSTIGHRRAKYLREGFVSPLFERSRKTI